MFKNGIPSDLGFMYISEEVSPEAYSVKNINVFDKHNLFYVEFDAILQTFKVLNRNIRQYLGENIDEQIKTDPKILSYLADSSWFGEMGHPGQDYQELHLTAERIMKIKQDNTSHKILLPKVENNTLYSKIQTDASTKAGENMAKKILQGMIPGFSCRALAKIVMMNGVPTVIIKKLITYDWVFYQSHKEARNITKPELISQTTNANRIVTESTDTCIPLKEILEYAGKKNVNTQIIMEEFELDLNSLQGFTPDAKQLIVKDNNNVIYSNMDPKLSREIKSYLSNL